MRTAHNASAIIRHPPTDGHSGTAQAECPVITAAVDQLAPQIGPTVTRDNPGRGSAASYLASELVGIGLPADGVLQDWLRANRPTRFMRCAARCGVRSL